MSIAIIVVLSMCLAYLFAVYLKTNERLSDKTKTVQKLEADLARAAAEIKTKTNELNKTNVEYGTYRDLHEHHAPMIEKLQHLDAVIEAVEKSERKLAAAQALQHKLDQQIDATLFHRELGESGFFSYKYEFEDIIQYKEALQIVRESQKSLLSNKTVLICEIPELDKSPIIACLRKIALRAFNSEFELLMDRLSPSNFETCKEKLTSLFSKINQELSVFRCAMNEAYLKLKVKELAIALEYELEQQRIKEEQRDLRDQMRDEEEARIEAERLREAAVEEEERYAALLKKAKEDALAASGDKQQEMQKKITDLEQSLAEAHLQKERATSLAQITRKGHVYIISNVGSFGDNVFKIGLTRREDPYERVRELSDASVPFRFDVHAIIKSEDAPKLESNLHEKLSEQRMNLVNNRKEFFRTSIDTIAETCRTLGYEVKLTQLAEAREYRQTLDLMNKKKAA